MIIGSIGIGLLILIIAWIIALIIFVAGIKFQSNVAWIALASATALTIILVIIPLESQTKNKNIEENDNLEKDYDFVYRVLLLSVLISSGFVGFICFFIMHCVEPIRPKHLKFYEF